MSEYGVPIRVTRSSEELFQVPKALGPLEAPPLALTPSMSAFWAELLSVLSVHSLCKSPCERIFCLLLSLGPWTLQLTHPAVGTSLVSIDVALLGMNLKV